MRKNFPMAFTVLALMVSIAAAAAAQSASHKLADKLIRRAQQVNSEIRATNLQVKKTLESYNYIVEGKAQDPRAEYKKLVKDLDKSLKARDKVRSSADSMQVAADRYFASWEESQSGYNSPEMKAKSEERLAKTREDYAKIFEAGESAGAEFDGFISKMDDQIRFLGQDLNPGAIAELQDEADELNEQADKFFKAINATLKTASSYTASLEPM